MSELIVQTSLIIWDEAPINHKYCFEALDRTLRDILTDSNPAAQNLYFGVKTIVFGGDFCQTLPLIQNSTKQQILRASIINSYLWNKCTLLQLTENMRLNSRGLSNSDKDELCLFVEWLLRVGSGSEHSIQMENESGNKYIKIPESLLLPNRNRGLDGLISFVYCFGCQPENPSSYFSDHAILAPTNEVVAAINTKMIQQLAYEEMSYYSSYSIDDCNQLFYYGSFVPY
jgi:ATP-dependent DNA helicase PIF1